MSDERDELAEARERKASAEQAAEDEVADARRMADLSRQLLRMAERALARRLERKGDD